MPVQNIECKLTQGQIGRYLAGENLPEATLFELERHLAECAECRKEVDRQRRDLLRQAGLAADQDPAERLVRQIAERQAPMERAAIVAPLTSRRDLRVWIKPALLSVLLVGLLGAMALAPQWRESLLGGSAAEAIDEPKTVSSTVLKTPTPSTKMAEVVDAKDPAPNDAAQQAAGRSHDANGNDEPTSRPPSGAASGPATEASTRRPETPSPDRLQPIGRGAKPEAEPPAPAPKVARRQSAPVLRSPARPRRAARAPVAGRPSDRSSIRVYDAAGRLVFPTSRTNP